MFNSDPFLWQVKNPVLRRALVLLVGVPCVLVTFVMFTAFHFVDQAIGAAYKALVSWADEVVKETLVDGAAYLVESWKGKRND